MAIKMGPISRSAERLPLCLLLLFDILRGQSRARSCVFELPLEVLRISFLPVQRSSHLIEFFLYQRIPRSTPFAYSGPNCFGSIRRIFPSSLDCMSKSSISDETLDEERSSDTHDETPKLHKRLANQLDEITEV